MNAQSVSYTADGTTVGFLFPFLIDEAQDLEVLLDNVIQSTGYTILGGEGANIGGAVRFATAPASGINVVLRRTGHVQVSATDAPGFLEAKVVAGANITVTKTTDASGEHLSIATAANPTDFLAKAQNLADLPNAATARDNLGLAAVAATGSYTDLSNKPTLGSAATHADIDFATAAQGAKADSALQSSDIGVSIQAHDTDLDWLAANLSSAGKALVDDADASAQRATLGLATVAASGSYTDLSNKPTLGSAAALNVDTDPTLAANSDSLLPSQKAIKAYADAKVATVLSSTSFASLEQDLAQTYLLSAMAGGWSAGTLGNGAYDAFNSDTIGANSSGQTYMAGYYGNPSSGNNSAVPNMTGYTSPSGTVAVSGTWSGAEYGWYVFDRNTATTWYSNTTTGWISYEFPSPQRCNRYGILVTTAANFTIAPTSWTFEGWSGAAWIALDTRIGVSLTPDVMNYFNFANANTYSKYRLNISANNGNPYYTGVTNLEIWPVAVPGVDMTLVSNALAPAPASVPTLVKLMVLYKAIDAATLNTDLTAEATRDGSTWNAGSMVDTGYSANGYKLLWTAVDVSNQPSGTSVKYRLKTLNAKNQQIKGVALMVN